MEAVFGAQATSRQETTAQYADGNGHESLTPPATYDTHLFAGGVGALTHSRTQPLVHPLLQIVRLPPMNSIFSPGSQTGGRISSQESGPRSVSASGTYVAGANGYIMQVNDRFHSRDGPLARRTAPGTINNWVDDGLPIDRSVEEFSVSFGTALNSFLQEQANAQAQERVAESAGSQGARPDSETTQHVGSEQNDDTSAQQENEHGGQGDHDMEETEEAESPNEEADAAPPPDQELQSEAAGLTISQPASDNNPNPSALNDQAAAEPQPADNVDAEMAEEGDEEGTVDDNAEEAEEQPDEPQHDEEAEGQSEESHDEQEEAGEGLEAGEETDAGQVDGEAPVQQQEDQPEPEQPEENNVGGGGDGALTCPPDIDPEVFLSLPLEMQQEIVQQHEVNAQIQESGLDPEALAALPEDMRREVIEQEQQQQRLREQQASQPADPRNAEGMYPTTCRALCGLIPN